MAKQEAVILSAVRTPIGKFQGALHQIEAPELGAVAIKEALHRAHVDPDSIDEVLMGQVLQAGSGQAPSRQAALKAGLPASVSATTINKVCGSGLKAVMLAAQAIRAGDGNLFVTGGMENMSRAPYLLPDARSGLRLGNREIVDSMVHDGLWCAMECQHMGLGAEWIARTYEVSRREQDEWALESHRRAISAQKRGLFDEEIVALSSNGKSETFFQRDEAPRDDTSLSALTGLGPVFEEDGTITAGNASPISDGAAALVVGSSSFCAEQGLEPLARIVGYAQAGVEPLAIFSAPVAAISRLMSSLAWDLADVDLFEINEAFAAQVVANVRELGIDPEKVNVNGGSIALGHPIGASGARVLVTLLSGLRQQRKRRGVAALCLGGGEAVALAVEL